MMKSIVAVLTLILSVSVSAEPMDQAGYVFKFTPRAKEAKFTVGTFQDRGGKRQEQTVVYLGKNSGITAHDPIRHNLNGQAVAAVVVVGVIVAAVIYDKVDDAMKNPRIKVKK